MHTIEIRQNKKTLIPMLILLTAGLIGMTYHIYFSGNYNDNSIVKLIYVFLIAHLIYTIFVPTRQFLKNEPVLKINESGMVINENGTTTSLLWSQIIEWRFDHDHESGTQYLIVKTVNKNKTVNISWLDKEPREIDIILNTQHKLFLLNETRMPG